MNTTVKFGSRGYISNIGVWESIPERNLQSGVVYHNISLQLDRKVPANITEMPPYFPSTLSSLENSRHIISKENTKEDQNIGIHINQDHPQRHLEVCVPTCSNWTYKRIKICSSHLVQSLSLQTRRLRCCSSS